MVRYRLRYRSASAAWFCPVTRTTWPAGCGRSFRLRRRGPGPARIVGRLPRAALLAEYQAVRAAAGEGWPGVRARLLRALNEGERANAPGSLEARVDIYLWEGMVDEAIRAVDAERYAGHSVLAKVAGAAWQSHPTGSSAGAAGRLSPCWIRAGRTPTPTPFTGWKRRGKPTWPPVARWNGAPTAAVCSRSTPASTPLCRNEAML